MSRFISSTARYLRANDPDGLNLDAELGDEPPVLRKTRKSLPKSLDLSALYWSENGEILCGKHAPAYRSDTWRSGRWKLVPKLGETSECTCEECGKGMQR